MAEFARYYLELFKAIGQDFLDYWRGVGQAWSEFFYNLSRYFEILRIYSGEFNFWSWVLTILSFLFILAILVVLVLKLIVWGKKYVKFYRSELDKDLLVEQVAELNNKLYQAVMEKNKILNLKVGQLGLRPNGTSGETEEAAATTDAALLPTRFVKLEAVDRKYLDSNTEIVMSDLDMVGLEQVVQRFRNYSASQLGLFYSAKTISLFFAGMATSKIIILEGLSGTGKTSLPYALGKFFQHSASIISVQPSWRDRAELLGYLNEFTKKFNETDFLRDLYESTYRQDLSFIILDEMNLARIEYYFAEFLSIMEMPDASEWLIDLVPNPQSGDPKHIRDGKLLVPQNVWFVGTANKDDSTFTITDKVYDRAIPIEFSARGESFDAEYAEPINCSYDYLSRLFYEASTNYPISTKTLERFSKLDDFLITKFKLPVGNRLLRQIRIFIPVFVACGGSELDALDYFFAHKILRKMETLNISYMRNELKELTAEIDKLFGKSNFLESKERLAELQRMI